MTDFLWRRALLPLFEGEGAGSGEPAGAEATPSADDAQPPSPDAASADTGEAATLLGDGGEGASPAETEESGDGDGEAKTDGAPEEYAEFQIPEGMEMDTEALGEFAPIAQELGLSQEQAQKFVSVYADAVQRQHDQQQEAFWSQVDQWKDATRNHEEIGGQNLETSIANANRVLKAFGGKEAAQVLEQTGLGCHPAIIGMLARAGAVIADDDFVTGNPTAGGEPPSRAAILYPDQT